MLTLICEPICSSNLFPMTDVRIIEIFSFFHILYLTVWTFLLSNFFLPISELIVFFAWNSNIWKKIRKSFYHFFNSATTKNCPKKNFWEIHLSTVIYCTVGCLIDKLIYIGCIHVFCNRKLKDRALLYKTELLQQQKLAGNAYTGSPVFLDQYVIKGLNVWFCTVPAANAKLLIITSTILV